MPRKKIITKEDILIALSVKYSDDKEFLKKINKLTFGLISQQEKKS